VVPGVTTTGGRRLIRAAIRLEPGNSGGPPIDARGRLAGLNAMVAGGLVLAIPAAEIESFVEQVLAISCESEGALAS